MRDLLLTLGHNASAVLVEDGHVLNAYELERITGLKSDSHFPQEAIETIIERSERRRDGHAFDRLYVCHWDPDNIVDRMKSKYWDRSVFRKDVPIIAQENLSMTHHDAHAYAALAFAGDSFPMEDSGILVVDGFGNMSEHISYYRLVHGQPMLVKRVFGYETSLGLMYQYATAFLGMKMHEDEYKLLGYGAKATECGVPIEQLNEIALKQAIRLRRELRQLPDPYLGTSLDNLPKVQSKWNERFQEMLDEAGLNGSNVTSFEARVVLGYVVQRVLETVLINYIAQDLGWPKNLICTGGVFYNVGLNRVILNSIQGKLCIMPLAGDQGNALGLWVAHNRREKLDFGDLCWGVRNFEHSGEVPDGLVVFEEDGPDVAQFISDQLGSVGFVNIVRGRMEFGPRALCNTTTLAIANRPEVIDEINRINGRNTVMPFAPVVWHEHLAKVFPTSEKLHKSERFMICACDYNPNVGEVFPGAALKTAIGKLTGRPQSYEAKYEGDSVAAVLKDYGLLINTSFNVHGVPIVCDMRHVIHSHQFQRERNDKVATIVIKERT
jgi:predicted NodU family carbamoyl transferase